MIEIDALTKIYDGTTVVDHVSLNIDKGDICVIVGTSGSGKTTLMRMINRLVEPTSGSVRIDGRDTRDIRAVRAAPRDRLRHPGARPVSAPHRRRRTSAPCRSWSAGTRRGSTSASTNC